MRRDNPHRRLTFINKIKDLLGTNLDTLEIGVAAGDFSQLILDKLPVKSHYMVDPWLNEGDNERSQWFKEGNDAEESYNFVINRFKNYPTTIIKKSSQDFFKENQNLLFDFIYIDGDHHSIPVYQDLKEAFSLLKPNGILGGDDYNWKSKTTGKFEVKLGVEKFEQEANIKFNIVKGDNGGLDQFWLKKQ